VLKEVLRAWMVDEAASDRAVVVVAFEEILERDDRRGGRE
jgi:hypothetical protein